MKKNKRTRSSEVPLSDEELQMLRNSIASERIDRSRLPHYDNSDKAKFIRYVKRNKAFAALCIILSLCVVTLMVIFAVMAVNKAMANKVNTDDFTIILGDKSTKVKYKDAMRGGILYVDMYEIAKYAGLTRTGSTSSVKFTADDNNYLRFENGEQTAVVNGCLVELGAKATVNEKTCDIPLEFLMKAVGSSQSAGLKIILDDKTNTIKVTRRYYKDDDGEVISPVEILFNADAFDVLQQIVKLSQDRSFNYGIDVTAYLSSIDPENAAEYLVLANKDTPLGESYLPSDLVELECKTNKAMKLRSDAATALFAMMLDMSASGIDDVFVTSAYRSYAYQDDLFDKYVAGHMAEGMSEEEAVAAALEYSARPGTSEHQTGLCVDFMTSTMTDLDESFEDTAAFKWLQENAYKYGFILRYPTDKTDVTGYKYEPWHYRFVGRTAATEIHDSGLCLEEYLSLN